MSSIIDITKQRIDEASKQLEDIKRAIKLLKNAGEDVIDLETKMIQLEAKIERWKRALKEI